jgi:hypothetical protein
MPGGPKQVRRADEMNKARLMPGFVFDSPIFRPTQMPHKIFEVAGHYRKAGAVVLERFGTQAEAVSFAREAAINYVEPGGGDSLIRFTVKNQATRQTLSTFYPDRYEADSLDDDDDG